MYLHRSREDQRQRKIKFYFMIKLQNTFKSIFLHASKAQEVTLQFNFNHIQDQVLDVVN